jgi:hypothetical protein
MQTTPEQNARTVGSSDTLTPLLTAMVRVFFSLALHLLALNRIKTFGKLGARRF